VRNGNLIAFLKPVLSRLGQGVEFLDVTDQVTDIEANSYRLTLRLKLAAGLYCGRFETKPNSFDMGTAMIDMVRVPDGKRVPVGPWDLDHLHNVMALPMMRTYVNGKLKGGLWFAMPGPDQIAESRLAADFGFEAHEGENELVLEIIERDRTRIDWGRLAYFELREDDRRAVPLLPTTHERPRLFVGAREIATVRERWHKKTDFQLLVQQLRTEPLVFLTDNSQGTLAAAMLVYAITGEERIGQRAKEGILELAHAEIWSGRPDPLLMGGENDRFVGLRLYHIALAWEYLQPLLSQADRRAILGKAETYIGKIYDFTLLQRAYLGYPSIEPHSLGSWNGAAIACMAFYEDLAIARHALPFFHGLFCDSLKLFPAGGKAAWATYFPFHLVLYLAAAETFAGHQPELSQSLFLDHLGQALLTAFEVPNSQELQRGLRTREHRFLTAFLSRFHPTPGIDSIYRAFVQKEQDATGAVVLGLFDLLYAPSLSGEIAPFPNDPLFVRDTGDLIAIARGEHVVALSVNAGPKAGRRANFTLMPQNREFAPSMGAIDLMIDGTPVLTNIHMSVYGLNSALTNTICLENGGVRTNGQYLNGDIPPDACALIRRCFLDDRYLYAHLIVTGALDPKLQVLGAERILVFDRKSGVLLVSDSFRGARPIRFATHLHCSGSISELGEGNYRLTGGQANLIAGIKGGEKGLSDEEKGEIFVQVMQTSSATRVVAEEPSWIPGYIYGLNHTGKEDMREGRFPRYQRWRLEATSLVTEGSFLFALMPAPGQVVFAGSSILLPGQGGLRLGSQTSQSLGVEAACECLLWDEAAHRVVAMGLSRLQHQAAFLQFSSAIDAEYCAETGRGTLYAPGHPEPEAMHGFALDPWVTIARESSKTNNRFCASFRRIEEKS
jgi:hypothetical protein